jgi:hypothetical protein
MDATTLWETFAEHAAIIMSGGRAPARGSGDGWFAVVTGEDHPELNQCALTSRATPADAEALVAFLAAHDVPALVSVASSAGTDVTAPLAAGGFARAPVVEPLMWCPRRPALATGDLRVALVCSAAERERALAVITDAHAMDAAIADRGLAPLPDPDGRVMAFLAYAGDEAVSVVWVTPGPRIGVWEMMTPARHRRRGAARAALTCALHATWDTATEGAFLLSTPAGRPFYEAVGFTAADDAVSWTIGADDALLAAIGQPPA